MLFQIAQSECENAKYECQRLNHQLDHVRRQLEETRRLLEQERQRSTTSVQAMTEHSELISKVQRLAQLEDSNAYLRERNDSQQSKINHLEAALKMAQKELAPLQEANKE